MSDLSFSTLTLARATLGLDSVTSIMMGGGCGLMVLQWTFSSGVEENHPTMDTTKTVSTPNKIMTKDGTTVAAIGTMSLFVQPLTACP